MANKMENPYDKFGAHPCKVTAGRKSLWVFTILFVLGISVPAIFRNIQDTRKTENRWVPAIEFWNHPNAKGRDALAAKRKNSSKITRTEPSLRDHLGAVESEIKAGDFRKTIAKTDQARLTAIFDEGTAKVTIGRDGWFFYQPGIDGLVGYGPLKPEPGSVAKNPDRAEWFPQLPVIEKFAAQLKQRGIELMIVPVPVKPMIHPEFLGARIEAPLRHRDQEKLYEKLREAGIDVFDLTDSMMKWKTNGKPLYLKQDTHWTHATMQRAAAAVAARVNKKSWFSEIPQSLETKTETITRTWSGDLVNMLTSDDAAGKYDDETQKIIRVLDAKTDAPPLADPESPIALLGDSFVNIYDTPSIGFGKEDEPTIGAGFAATLAKELGTQLDIHTANGGGATAVRKDFAGSGKDIVAKKKLVIWTIASRDFLLSETPGNTAGVRWRDVEFSERTSSGTAPFSMIGTLTERSALDDPKTTPYDASVYSALFKVEEIAEGTYKPKEAMVFLWGFQDRKMLPTSKFQVGDKIRLELVPIIEAKNIKGIKQADDLFADLPQMFATKAELLTADKGLKIRGLLIFAGLIIAYVIAGIAIQMRQRKTSRQG